MPGAVQLDEAAFPVLLAGKLAELGVALSADVEEMVRRAIAQEAWTPIEYTDAVYDSESGQWISRAEVAEVPFTAFSSRKSGEQITGRLVVRRVPDINRPANPRRFNINYERCRGRRWIEA